MCPYFHGEIRILLLCRATTTILSIGKERHRIGLDKRGYQIVFLFLDKRICCGYSLEQHILLMRRFQCEQKHVVLYSLEVPHRGTSNEYPQHMFSSRNKKNIGTFWLKKVPYQELCLGKQCRPRSFAKEYSL